MNNSQAQLPEEAVEIKPLDNPQKMIYDADSYKAVRDEMNEWAAPRGYAIILAGGIKKDKDGQVRRVRLRCDRGGSYQPSTNQTGRHNMRTTNKRIDCKWCFYLRHVVKESGATVWEVHLPDGETEWRSHNHEASISPAAHVIHRQTALKYGGPIRNEIYHSFDLGIMKPGQIYAETLKTFGADEPITRKDVYNIIDRWRRHRRQGLSPIQSITLRLNESTDWMVRYWPEQGHIERLFFTHRECIELLKDNYDFLMADCTYSTNRFGMKLLDIVGVTKLNSTFFVGFCLLAAEEKESFSWALRCLKEIYSGVIHTLGPLTVMTDRQLSLINALQEVFPASRHLLCIWHVEKNILKNCKKYITADNVHDPTLTAQEKIRYSAEMWRIFLSEWNKVVYAGTEDDFNSQWVALKSQYMSFPQVIAYIDDSWMPWREHWAAAWTNKTFHLFERATSRVEAAHRHVKRTLDCQSGIPEVIQSVSNLVMVQCSEERKKTARGRLMAATELSYQNDSDVTRPSDINTPLYRDLWGHVSLYAIRRAAERARELRSVEGPLPRCTNTTYRGTGIPCKHTIRDRLCSGGSLRPRDFHPQWLFSRGRDPSGSGDGPENRTDQYTVIFEPFRSTDAAATRRLRVANTGRVLSGFENVNNEINHEILHTEAAEPTPTHIHEPHTRARPRCSICHSLGHNARRCPNQPRLPTAETTFATDPVQTRPTGIDIQSVARENDDPNGEPFYVSETSTALEDEEVEFEDIICECGAISNEA